MSGLDVDLFYACGYDGRKQSSRPLMSGLDVDYQEKENESRLKLVLVP